MSTRLLRLGLALAAGASAQTLVEPERIAERQEVFDTSASVEPLRCRIDPVRPALDYALRFRTGYTAEFPILQFAGSGHSLNTYVRVTPEGQKPVYLEITGDLPDMPAAKADAVLNGTFVVGEGSYDVEVLLEDETHRVCHNRWHILAKRSGTELQLAPSTPPGAVEELNVRTDSGSPPAASGARRITLMLHAAPLVPSASQLQDTDISALSGSLYTLFRQLPAEPVRLIVFNVAQRAVPIRQDNFTLSDLDRVIEALGQLQLAKVDYRTLRQQGGPGEFVANLLRTELQDPHPTDVVVLIGPRVLARDDVPIPALDPPAAARALFYLQYLPQPRLNSAAGQMPGGGRGGRMTVPGDPIPPAGLDTASIPRGLSDILEKLCSRLKGKVLPVHAPHDLADSMRRIQMVLPQAPVPAGTAAPSAPPRTPPTPTPSVPPPSAQAAPPEPRRSSSDPSSAEGPLDLAKAGKVAPVADTDPVDLMVRLRDQVLEHAVRIPNHTCVETVERARFEPVTGHAKKSCDNILASRRQPGFQSRLRLDTTDRLRLDVAMAPDKEIFSWAGASKFEEGDIDELIPHGAIGTGSFASFLLSTFADRSPQFIFEGDRDEAGRQLMEYSFTVPRDESHYRVKASHHNWIITGYTGTLLVDAKTAELVKFLIRTEELPSEIPECETATTLEYGTIQLGGDDYLLPKTTRQRFIGRDGTEDENTTTFSACREFQAESTVSFDGSTAARSAAGAATPALDPALGLPVTVELLTPVNFDQSAAGDRIEGRVVKAIREGQKIVVPEGARVHGRLMRVEIRHSSPVDFTAALRWESVEIDGQFVPWSLRPDHRPSIRSSMGGLRPRGMTIELPLPGEGDYGVYHSRAPVLAPGLQTEWLTAKP